MIILLIAAHLELSPLDPKRMTGCAEKRLEMFPYSCDKPVTFLTCPGMALPVHRTNGFKWLPNHWALHVYFSLTRSEGGMGARNVKKKAPYLWINLINQQYRPFCRKIKIQLHKNPFPMQTRTHTQINRFCFIKQLIFNYSTCNKILSKISSKMQTLGQSGPRILLFYSLTALNLRRHVLINLHYIVFQFQNTKYSSFWGCTCIPPQTLPVRASVQLALMTHPIHRKRKMSKTNLHPCINFFYYCKNKQVTENRMTTSPSIAPFLRGNCTPNQI